MFAFGDAYVPWCPLVFRHTPAMAVLSKYKRQCVRVAMAAVIVMRMRRERNKRRPRRWVLPHIEKHEQQGCYANLVKEIRANDIESFANFSRVYPDVFDKILQLITPAIQRCDTFFRKCISPGERLGITLRFLATGKHN